MIIKKLLPLLLALPFVASAASPAGTVVLLTGQATALSPDGTVRKLAKSAPVFAGDLVSSGAGSYVNLKFADGAFFLLRPETRFQIEQFEFAAAPAATPPPAAAPAAPAAPKPAAPAATPLVTAGAQAAPTSRAFFRLVKGGFRSVSGLIGKLNREDYRLSTPVATIGIRGTTYSARLCEGGNCPDREEIVTDLAAAGKSVGSEETMLITTVDDGQIAVGSAAGETLQDACIPSGGSGSGSGASAAGGGSSGDGGDGGCTALITSEDGSSTVVPRRPDTERNERNLDPAQCL